MSKVTKGGKKDSWFIVKFLLFVLVVLSIGVVSLAKESAIQTETLEVADGVEEKHLIDGVEVIPEGAEEEFEKFDFDYYVANAESKVGERIRVEGVVIQKLESEEKSKYLLLLDDLDSIDYDNPKRMIVEESLEGEEERGIVYEGDKMEAIGTFKGIALRHKEGEVETGILKMEID